MHILVLTNPASGDADNTAQKSALTQLEALGRITTLEANSDVTHDEIRDAAADAGMVVVIGGDGTMHHAVNALSERLERLTFALVPMGTGNDLARSLGIPLDPEDAARRIATGGTVRIDIGKASGDGIERLFVNGCVGGFPVHVDEAIEGDIKKRLGPLAFWVGGVKALPRARRFTIEVNGAEFADCIAAGVGNGRTVGGGIELWPRASLRDGELDVCALAFGDAASAARLLPRVKAGSHERLDHVATWRAARIEIEAQPRIEFNVDGELVGLHTPATFEVAGSLAVAGADVAD